MTRSQQKAAGIFLSSINWEEGVESGLRENGKCEDQLPVTELIGSGRQDKESFGSTVIA
ncbi:hypothetical protein JOC94_000578 [Bacillus thermophilus]|uniref:Uncharacterized protein n=1 Tax=Siminovitchia thermophila TaxID=1245522 RepID=A0ABS2R207_9BACI|nr:hypothetical protein [Siminovitchia thermophila]MBM7713609.1 hypothetical protein [Siminovitchia thermophila]